MKRKNLFILIAIVVAALLIFLIYFLNNSTKDISKEHIKLKFVIHNCANVAPKKSELRSEYIRPLLQHFSLKKSGSDLERNYFTSITCDKISFCIPAKGINAFRYNPNDISFYSSVARSNDEEAFFSNWDGGDKFKKLENELLKGGNNYDYPSIFDLNKQNPSEFIDSFILDRNYSGEKNPFIFKSAIELRSFVNKQISMFPRETDSIHIFTYCGKEYLQNPDDTDNDGVLNKYDNCPNEIGNKSNKGCPIPSDKDSDGITDSRDKCPGEYGEKKCDGCKCPPSPPCDDRDNDGICDNKDNCPGEFGFPKYRGCPIPDTDKDGLNDEVDKCPKDYGPLNNDGCPLKINILHNNSVGKFTVEGIGNINDYNVIMSIRQTNGKIVEHKFSGYVCPYKDESKKIVKGLGDPVDLDITISVRDKNNKEIKSFKFNNLSMICFSDESCGFVDLDKY
jgi:hypothetical protein